MFGSMVTLRPAHLADYDQVEALFAELNVPGHFPDRSRFETEWLPVVIVATRAVGAGPEKVVGYIWPVTAASSVHIRHLAVSPDVRRQGVAKALMLETAKVYRAQGKTSWWLNVKPENEAAIALYQSLDFTAQATSAAVSVTWDLVLQQAQRALAHEGRDIGQAAVDDLEGAAPWADRKIEALFGFESGRIDGVRSLGHRVLRCLVANGKVVSFGAFDPGFPGSSPIAAVSPEWVWAQLATFRSSARPGETSLSVFSEDERVANELLAHGAKLELRVMKMVGKLPESV
jgi:ribosomal protein S18 acetylase RimI-like enzyme